MANKSTRTDPVLEREIKRLTNEILSIQESGRQYENSQIGYYRLIATNPLIKYPEVQLSCGLGTSYLFDIDEVRKATKILFAAYGIELETQVPIIGEGYAFTADGYNRELNIGFEIRTWTTEGYGWHAYWAEQESGPDFLGHNELVALEHDVKRNNIAMFVCDPNELYRGDEYLSMAYYLASLLDYLNWVHGDREVNYQRILDDTKEPYDVTPHPLWTLKPYWKPGSESGIFPWVVDHGECRIDVVNNQATLILKLDPDASATYHPVETPPDSMAATPLWTDFRVTMSQVIPNDIPADIDLHLNGEPGTRFRKTFLPENAITFDFGSHNEETGGMSALQCLSITNVNSFPIELHILRIEEIFYHLASKRRASILPEQAVDPTRQSASGKGIEENYLIH